jgi:MoxR-like ATPase
MKASVIFEAVNLLVEARQPVFVWGERGIGKSEVMFQVAEARKVPLHDIRALLLDPVDLRGLPHLRTNEQTHRFRMDRSLSRRSGPRRTSLPRDGESRLGKSGTVFEKTR